MTAQMKWGTTSLYNLKGIHPDLRKVCDRALYLSSRDFRILDGLRTKAEQTTNVKKGVSQTMNSRHLTGHAIDFGVLKNGGVDWADIPGFVMIGMAFKQAAKELNIPIVYGGDWRTLKDYGHVELSRKAYP